MKPLVCCKYLTLHFIYILWSASLLPLCPPVDIYSTTTLVAAVFFLGSLFWCILTVFIQHQHNMSLLLHIASPFLLTNQMTLCKAKHRNNKIIGLGNLDIIFVVIFAQCHQMNGVTHFNYVWWIIVLIALVRVSLPLQQTRKYRLLYSHFLFLSIVILTVVICFGNLSATNEDFKVHNLH